MTETPVDISVEAPTSQLLLGARDCATLCGCTVRTWRSWNTAGLTPEPTRIGKSVFWRPKELRDWVDAGCPKREQWLQVREDY